MCCAMTCNSSLMPMLVALALAFASAYFTPNIMQEGENLHLRLGSKGADAGEEWDDGFHEEILQIFIWHSAKIINSVQFAYRDAAGETKLSPQHGADGADFEAIRVRGSVLEMSGHYDGERGIVSLTVVTSSGRYGPYGAAGHSTRSFCFKAEVGIRGFHGRAADDRLTAIGVYVDSKAKQFIGE